MQALNDIQADLSKSLSEVAFYHQLLRENGFDPDAIVRAQGVAAISQQSMTGPVLTGNAGQARDLGLPASIGSMGNPMMGAQTPALLATPAGMSNGMTGAALGSGQMGLSMMPITSQPQQLPHGQTIASSASNNLVLPAGYRKSMGGVPVTGMHLHDGTLRT